jgi:hypothetical protein
MNSERVAHSVCVTNLSASSNDVNVGVDVSKFVSVKFS